MMAHTPYGYIVEKGEAAADNIKALQVKALFEEYARGLSLQAAGTKAGIEKSHASLGRIIDTPCYKGDDFYPVIVSHDLWNKAQAERKRRADVLGRNKNYFSEDKTAISPFWDKIFCTKCGQPYRRYSEKGKQRWRCSQRGIGGKVYCNSPMFFEYEFEEAFMRMLGNIDLTEVAAKPPRKPIDIDQKYDDPFKQAEYAYSLTQIDDFEFQTAKLLSVLNTVSAEFDGEFMRQITQRIEVTHCGEISFGLINEKICKEAMAYGNITTVENVGYTSEKKTTDNPK